MANRKITELTQALDIKENDLLVIVDMTEGQTERITKLQFERSLRLAELQGTTNNIIEGPNNLYWTNSRFDARLATKTTDDLIEGQVNKYLTLSNLQAVLNGGGINTDLVPEGLTNLYWRSYRFDASFGAKTTSDLAEGSNRYYTESRFNNSWALKTTDNLPEGTVNKYFTNARVCSTLATCSINQLGDVDTVRNPPLPNYLLAWSGTNWVPRQPEAFSDSMNVLASPTDSHAGFLTQKIVGTPGRVTVELLNDVGTTGNEQIKINIAGDFFSTSNNTTSDIAEGTNLYYTQARFDTAFAAKSTTDLAEGTNLYYTNARVQSVINSMLGSPNGIASLGPDGKLPSYQIPAIAFNDVNVVQDIAARDALAANEGDIAKVIDSNGSGKSASYIYDGSTWLSLATDDLIYSVNGQIGHVVLTTTHVAEGSNLYWTSGRFNSSFAAKTTTDLAEGTNLYWTPTRFDTRLATKTTDNLTQGTTNRYYSTSLFNADLATKSTSDLAEGSRLYWTQARFDTAFAAKSTSDLVEGSRLYWTSARFDTRLATKTTDDLAEGTVNLYWTAARFDSRFATRTTTNLAEGTNLYFTNTRAISAIGGSKNDSGTGTADLWSASKILSHLSTNHFLKSEFVSSSAGVADAFKPVRLNASGVIDSTMVPSFQIVGASESNHTTLVSTSSTSFVLCPGMTLTPPAGSYLVIFNSDLDLSNNNKTCQLRITSNGVEISNSMRYWTQSNSTNRDSLVTFAIVTVNGSQPINGEWRVEPLSTGSVLNSSARTLKLIKVSLS